MPAETDISCGSHCQLIELAEKRVELYRKRMKKKKHTDNQISDQLDRNEQ
jgi:hypothetical protein